MADTLIDKRVEEFLRELPTATREEIGQFKELVEQYFLGQITPDEFKAKRLHLGTYGIRGTKDVHMMRIKIPQGQLTAEQLECLADLAQAYSKNIGHLTTRQDMQLYWIPTQEAPLAMAKAAATGLTTREACGNSVRNVTACPIAGLSPTEVFDVTKHAYAVTRHFLRNPASQKLPRKFKIAFEGCPVDHARTPIHDIGAVAAIKEEGGKKTLGFRLYVGGGLGAAPMSAILLEPFTPATDLLRTCEAAVRVHDRLGDRKNKATARIKFVVKRLGPDAFRQEVFAERKTLPQYSYPEMSATETDEQPPVPANDIPASVSINGTFTPPPAPPTVDAVAIQGSASAQRPSHDQSTSLRLGAGFTPPPAQLTVDSLVTLRRASPGRISRDRSTSVRLEAGFTRWMFTNVMGQKQPGYSIVTIRLRLGDISTEQMRPLAAITRRYCGGRLRMSIEQNLLLCWIRNEHLAALFSELEPIGLAETEANKLYDVTSCPGAETCQLGIAASRGLARAVETTLKGAGISGEDVENLHIKISGCPNSCGQHHIADIGFFGGARKVNDHLTPHFQLMLGGMTEEGKAVFGESIVKLPARRIPDAIVGILQRYRQDRTSVQEPFRAFVTRVGAAYWKGALVEFTTLPSYTESPDSYRDWGAETEFSLGGMGPGECAA